MSNRVRGTGGRWPMLGCLALFALLARVGAPSSASTRVPIDPRSTPMGSGGLPHPALYSVDSPFNVPIPVEAEIDPESNLYVQGLREAVGRGGFVLAVKRWTVPVYFAEPGTPRYTVRLTARWAPVRSMADVPIPPQARPDPSGDGHMTVVDTAANQEYDFWRARKRGKRWTAAWANQLSTTGPGTYPEGLSCRGSGFALLAGMIWPDELAGGRIPHALVFTYPHTRAGGPVPPATESDGTSRRPDALPEGARVQLDPSLDLDSLDLTPYERTIARALQEFGMYLGDDGGGIELEAIHPQSATSNPYAGLLPNQTYVSLDSLPVDRFRVLKLP